MSQPRIVYLNGKYLPVDQAYVSVMDRGFLFADGVYEVIPLLDRRLVGGEEHLQRLKKSLAAIAIPFEFESSFFIDIFKKLMEYNPDQGDDRAIYLQITRGVPEFREHVFPSQPVKPTIFVQSTQLHPPGMDVIQEGGAVVTVEDVRWQWCYIKSVSLLPNVLSTQKAKELGAKEAILVRDGRVMEGASSNVFVIKNNEIFTPPANEQILKGITRDLVLKLLAENDIPCHEKNISEQELYNADEVWITSSTKEIFPIVKINGHDVGDGKAGPMWSKVMGIYQAYKRALPVL